MLTYTYEIEHAALPVSQYRVFESFEAAADFAWGVALDHEIPLQEVCLRHGNARIAAGGNGKIHLPNTEFGFSVITILHELAHVAAPAAADHGTEWYRWFTFLLRNEVSITAEAALLFESNKEPTR